MYLSNRNDGPLNIHYRPLSMCPGAQLVKNLPDSAGEAGSIPGSGRSPGEGHGYQFQYSHLENPMGRGAWQATVHGVVRELDMT